MADHTRAIQLDPELAGAYGQRAATLMLMDQPTLAAQDYKRATEIDPEYDLGHIALAAIYANSRVPEVHDPEGAIEHAYRACELTGYRLPHYLWILSDSYRAAGKDEQAKKYLAQAKQLAREYLGQNWQLMRYR